MAGNSQLIHGARAAALAYQRNALDRRCGWVRQFLAIRAEMLLARGVTDATCDADRRSLIDRIAFKRVQVEMHQRAAMKAATDTSAPVELPANFFKLSETLRRDELALAQLDRHTAQARSRAHDWTHDEDGEADGDAAAH